MKEYLIHFEFFGRNMKTKVFADSESEAKQKVARRINFHKVERTAASDLVDKINDIFKGIL